MTKNDFEVNQIVYLRVSDLNRVNKIRRMGKEFDAAAYTVPGAVERISNKYITVRSSNNETIRFNASDLIQADHTGNECYELFLSEQDIADYIEKLRICTRLADTFSNPHFKHIDYTLSQLKDVCEILNIDCDK